jgi:hypothetical protein
VEVNEAVAELKVLFSSVEMEELMKLFLIVIIINNIIKKSIFSFCVYQVVL